MRRSITALSLFLLCASLVSAKDVLFPIAGSSNNVTSYRTDVRLFNPSTSKDITIQAYLLPVGNRDNSGVTPHTVSVSKRQMVSLNDVVTALGGADLNAIRLTSSDDFVATERVYAQQSPNGSCNIAGTVGQDVTAFDPAVAAKKQGVLLQLKTTTGDCGQNGVASFRTNIGVVNPNTATASVTFRLFDRNNNLVSTGSAITVPPMGVISPTNMASGLFFSPGAADLGDSWVSFTSDQALLVYASLIDNCTADATFIPLAEDAVSTGSKDIYFPTAGPSKTDVRLFNPSSSKDITVQAFILPVGNHDNSSAASHPITVPKRQMVVLNDAVTTLGGTDLNALRLTSTDTFVANERVYSQQVTSGACNIAGTLGEDVAALDPSSAKKQGVMLQLKTSSGNCSQGSASFHSNIGVVNPNTTAANVTFRLYDKNNALISSGSAIALPPMAVIAPTNIGGGFFFTPGAADLSDAWVSYTSDQPIFTFASLVDTCTTDPMFIPMSEDTGGSASTSTLKAFSVTTHNFAIDWSPVLTTGSIAPGDQVTLTISGRDQTHGFELDDPEGVPLIVLTGVPPGQVFTRTITFTKEGTYNYYCIVPTCGLGIPGHSNMFGQFVVGKPSDDPNPRY